MRLVFGLQPEQARTLAGARIDHRQELLAGARGAEQQPAAAVGHDLLDAGALGQAERGRQFPDRPLVGVSPEQDQHQEQGGAGDQRDPAGDDKGLEQVRDGVHL